MITDNANGRSVSLNILSGSRLGIRVDMNMDDRNNNTNTVAVTVSQASQLIVGGNLEMDKDNGDQNGNDMTITVSDDSRVDVIGNLSLICTEGNPDNDFGITLTENSIFNANSVSGTLNDDIQGISLISLNATGVAGDAAIFNVTNDFDLDVAGNQFDIEFDLDYSAQLIVGNDFNVSANGNDDGRNYRWHLDRDALINVGNDFVVNARPRSNGDIEFHLNQTTAGALGAQIIVGNNISWSNNADNDGRNLEVFLADDALIDVEGDFAIDMDGSGSNEDLLIQLADNAVIDVEGNIDWIVNDGDNVDFRLTMNDQAQILAGDAVTDVFSVDMINGCGEFRIFMNEDATINAAGDIDFDYDGDLTSAIQMNQTAAGTGLDARILCGRDFSWGAIDGDDFEIRMSEDAFIDVEGTFLFSATGTDGDDDDQEFVLNDNALIDVEDGMSFTINDNSRVDLRFDLTDNAQILCGNALGEDFTVNMQNGPGEFDIELDGDALLNVAGDFDLTHDGDEPIRIHLNENTAGVGADAQFLVGENFTISQVDGDQCQIFLNEGADIIIPGDLTTTHSNIDDGGDDITFDLANTSAIDVGGSFTTTLNDDSGVDINLFLSGTSELNVGDAITDSLYLGILNGATIFIRMDDSPVINVTGNIQLQQEDDDDNDQIQVYLNQTTSGAGVDAVINAGGYFYSNMSDDAGRTEFLLDADAELNIGTDFIVDHIGTREVRIYLNNTADGDAADVQISIGDDFIITNADGEDLQIFLRQDADIIVSDDFEINASNQDGNNDDIDIELANNSSVDVDGSFTVVENDNSNIDIVLDMNGTSTFNVGTTIADTMYLTIEDGSVIRIDLDDDATLDVSGRLHLHNQDAGNGDNIEVDLNQNSATETNDARLNVGNDMWFIIDNAAVGGEVDLLIDHDAQVNITGDLRIDQNGDGNIDIWLNEAFDGGALDAQLVVSEDVIINKTDGDLGRIFLDQGSLFDVEGDFTYLASNMDGDDDDQEIQLEGSSQLDVEGDFLFQMNDASRVDLRVDMSGTSQFTVGTTVANTTTFNVINGYEIDVEIDEDASFSVSGDVIMNKAGNEEILIHLNQIVDGSAADAQFNIARDLIMTKTDGDQVQVHGNDGSDLIIGRNLSITTSNTDDNGDDVRFFFGDNADLTVGGDFTAVLNENPGRLVDLFIRADSNAVIDIAGDVDIDLTNAEDLELTLNSSGQFNCTNFNMGNTTGSRGVYFDLNGNGAFNASGNFRSENLSTTNTPTATSIRIDEDASLTTGGDFELIHNGNDDCLICLNQNVAGTTTDARLIIGGDFIVDKDEGDDLNMLVNEDAQVTVAGNLTWDYGDTEGTNDGLRIRLDDNSAVDIEGSLNINYNNSTAGGVEPFELTLNNTSRFDVGPAAGPYTIESATFIFAAGGNVQGRMNGTSQMNVYGDLVFTKQDVDDWNFRMNNADGTNAELNVFNDLVLDNVDDDEIMDFELNQDATLDVDGNIDITGALSAGKIELELNNTSEIQIEGNFLRNPTPNKFGILDCNGASEVEYDGVTNTQLFAEDAGDGGDFFDYQNVTVNNTFGTSPQITMEGLATVHTGVTFVDGVVATTLTDILVFDNDATSTGPSDVSHVDGWARKIGDDAFEFPVGDIGVFRPISVSAPGATADQFRAIYTSVDPNEDGFDDSAIDPTIDHISNCEYWELELENGTPTVSVTLSYKDFDPSRGCSGVVFQPDLLVSRWDGAVWRDEGNGATAGIPSDGTVTSAGGISTFSPFTLASTTPINPLPIELLSFQATAQDDHVLLEWVTASERDNDYFTIERSIDGINFEDVGVVDGAGNSSVTLEYDLIDPNPYLGWSYYRLKQTDYNGEFSYSEPDAVYFGTESEFTIYPNPLLKSGQELTIISNFEINDKTSIIVMDAKGTVVSQNVQRTYLGDRTKLINLSLSHGVYFISITRPNGEVVTAKLVVI